MDKVTNILLNRIIEKAQTSGRLPWERPWECFNAMNWVTMKEYRGINRFLLKGGEYVTANQMRDYNKKNGTTYKFKKGIEWEIVLFVKRVEKVVPRAELPEPVVEMYNAMKSKGKLGIGTSFIGYGGSFGYYFTAPNTFTKVRLVRVFHNVADIRWFEDEEGNQPPSRLTTGEVIMTITKPENIADNYLKKEGIPLTNADVSQAFYVPARDKINMPPMEVFKNSEGYYSTLFHEMAHSTGAMSRLNREGIVKVSRSNTIRYAKEELVAELACCLLCGEAGIHEYSPQGLKEFDNHVAYVQGYLKYIKTMEDDIVYICSDAEKAFQYIMQATQETGSSEVEC